MTLEKKNFCFEVVEIKYKNLFDGKKLQSISTYLFLI